MVRNIIILILLFPIVAFAQRVETQGITVLHKYGTENIFVGQNSGATLMVNLNNNSKDNTAIGYGSLKNAKTGAYNTVVGAYAGGRIVSADSNVWIGYNAGNHPNFQHNGSIGGIDNSNTPFPLVYFDFEKDSVIINGCLRVVGCPITGGGTSSIDSLMVVYGCYPNIDYLITTSDTIFIDTCFSGGGGGTSDHGLLTGLEDDDHEQYALLDGRLDDTLHIDNISSYSNPQLYLNSSQLLINYSSETGSTFIQFDTTLTIVSDINVDMVNIEASDSPINLSSPEGITINSPATISGYDFGVYGNSWFQNEVVVDDYLIVTGNLRAEDTIFADIPVRGIGERLGYFMVEEDGYLEKTSIGTLVDTLVQYIDNLWYEDDEDTIKTYYNVVVDSSFRAAYRNTYMGYGEPLGLMQDSVISVIGYKSPNEYTGVMTGVSDGVVTTSISAVDASNVSVIGLTPDNIFIETDSLSIYGLPEKPAPKVVVWDDATMQISVMDISDFGGGTAGDTCEWYLSSDTIINKSGHKVYMTDSIYVKRDAIPLLKEGEPLSDQILVLRKLSGTKRQIAKVPIDMLIDSLIYGGISYWARDAVNGELYQSTLTDQVGIGTADPSEMLDVVGNINLVATTSTVGQFKIASVPMLHNYHEEGDNNLFIGQGAGNFTLDSSFNVGIGPSALKNLTTGFCNTAIGYQSGLNGNSSYNTAVGQGSLNYLKGGYNTAIGAGSLGASGTGMNNVAVGSAALGDLTDAIGNVGVGHQAAVLTTTGDFNTAVGGAALGNNEGNSGSVAIGYQTMLYADDRSVGRITYNTAVGYQAMRGSTTPTNNTGQYNTATGYQALDAMTSGYRNCAMGYASLGDITTGYSNVGIGYESITSTDGGFGNTAVGYQSLAILSGTTDPIYNTALGFSAMQGIIGGTHTSNIAIGGYSLGSAFSSTVSEQNIFIGTAAGQNAASATSASISYNTVIGYYSGRFLADSIGKTCTDNIMIGRLVGGNTGASGLTYGNDNIAIGSFLMQKIRGADNNVIIGPDSAGYELTTGDYNIYIGSAVGKSQTTERYKVRIGQGDLFYGEQDTDSIRLNGDVVIKNDLWYEDTFWKDATVSAYDLAGGVNSPTLKAVVGGLMGMGFNPGVANDEAYGQVQLNHDYKLGTDIEAHCHYAIDDPPAGGNDTVVVEFEYSWADIGEAFPATSTVTKKIVVNGKSTGTHYLEELVSTITSDGGDGLSSVVMFRVERLQDNASDTYPGWWILLDVDFHHQINSPGSRTETSK